jgi:drug/metabolite transporter (DMT)-like permease
MGLVIGAVLIAFVGVLLGLLGPNEATLAVMVMIVTGVVLAITGVVLWIYGAKDKLKKNSKLPKPSLII